jgi:hypothetical protein
MDQQLKTPAAGRHAPFLVRFFFFIFFFFFKEHYFNTSFKLPKELIDVSILSIF